MSEKKKEFEAYNPFSRTTIKISMPLSKMSSEGLQECLLFAGNPKNKNAEKSAKRIMRQLHDEMRAGATELEKEIETIRKFFFRK
ncbi:MAG: hypothetical protein ABIK73_07300 [candidate division WOR-3 bacterium]